MFSRSLLIREHWKNHRAAELVYNVIIPPQKTRTELGFRSAVDIDHNRARPVKFLRIRQIEEPGDFSAVERFPGYGHCFDELGCRDSPRFAFGPARHFRRI